MSMWSKEPALMVAGITGVIDAGLILLVTFGIAITPDQKVAIDGFVSAILALVGLMSAGAITRTQVVPTVQVPTPPAPPTPSAK